MAKKQEVQDNAREDQMIKILKLKKVRGRLGHDAEDENGNKFELKSSTKNAFGTGRDVSVDMIKKWEKLHWIFATGTNYEKTGFKIESIYYCSPTMMKQQFAMMKQRYEPDIEIRNNVVKNTIRILNKCQLDRLEYLINRGMTYNNPHIGMKYVKANGIEIDMTDPAKSLRQILADQL